MLAEIARKIKESDNFVISSHISPDGDSTGSQLAMYGILKKLNKKVSIIDADPIPRIYNFLPNSEVKVSNYTGETNFDVAIILDCADITRLGKLPIDLKKIKTIINIDHHISNNNYGELNYVDANASSTGEIIARLLRLLNMIPDIDIATCLYSSILTDTGGFKFENTTSGAFAEASELLKIGLLPAQISKKIYENNELKAMQLLGLSLETLTLKADGKIGVMFVTKDMFNKTLTSAEHTESFVNYARTVAGVEVGVFFRETDNGTVKVSMRSKEAVDTNKIAKVFGGGGHAKASGCDVPGNLETVKEKVLAAIENEINNTSTSTKK